MAAPENLAIVRSQYDLFNSRKLDQMLEPVSDKVEILNIATGETLRGKEAYRGFARSWITAFSDARIEVKNVVVSDAGACVEFVGSGTHDGPFTGPEGTIQPTKKKLQLRLCDVYQLQGGKIVGLHTYFDLRSMLRQLGIKDDVDAGSIRRTEQPAAHPH